MTAELANAMTNNQPYVTNLNLTDEASQQIFSDDNPRKT